MNEFYVKDLCTVIITSYQREKYILSTARSIFNQTYRPIELIVIEDGSTDKTFQLLNSWKNEIENDKDFKFVLIKQENTGAPKARNRALAISEGEYIQEIGSDDLLSPFKLEHSVRLLQQNLDCQSVWAPMRRFVNIEEEDLFNEIKVNRINYSVEKKSTSNNVFEPQFMPSAGFHRREVFFSAGPWNESLVRWQDLEYQVKMMKVISNYIVIENPMYYFRQHDDGRINDLYKKKKGLDSGILALKAVENELPTQSLNDGAVRKTMSDFYLSLFEIAVEHEIKQESRFLLNKANQWRKERKFWIKVFLLKRLFSFGVKPVKKVLSLINT